MGVLQGGNNGYAQHCQAFERIAEEARQNLLYAENMEEFCAVMRSTCRELTEVQGSLAQLYTRLEDIGQVKGMAQLAQVIGAVNAWRLLLLSCGLHFEGLGYPDHVMVGGYDHPVASTFTWRVAVDLIINQEPVLCTE